MFVSVRCRDVAGVVATELDQLLVGALLDEGAVRDREDGGDGL